MGVGSYIQLRNGNILYKINGNGNLGNTQYSVHGSAPIISIHQEHQTWDDYKVQVIDYDYDYLRIS